MSPQPKYVSRREGAAAELVESVDPIGLAPDDTPPDRPSALDLARLSRHRVFPPGGEKLYRHLIRLVELSEDHEFVLAPCGRGVTARFLARTSGAAGSGVDPDAELIEAAEAAARADKLSERLQFDVGSLTDLPYQDDVFDVAIGEVGLAAAADPAAAVRELVRVTKPMGTVVLAQLVWAGNVEPAHRRLIAEALGVQPFLLVEWKQILREAGVVDLYVEDWSDAAPSLRNPSAIGVLAESGSLRDRAGVLFRAWRRWGVRGLRSALEMRSEVRELITRERILGLSLIRGTKWPATTDDSEG